VRARVVGLQRRDGIAQDRWVLAQRVTQDLHHLAPGIGRQGLRRGGAGQQQGGEQHPGQHGLAVRAGHGGVFRLPEGRDASMAPPAEVASREVCWWL
jgi:hypothetical protein